MEIPLFIVHLQAKRYTRCLTSISLIMFCFFAVCLSAVRYLFPETKKRVSKAMAVRHEKLKKITEYINELENSIAEDEDDVLLEESKEKKE